MATAKDAAPKKVPAISVVSASPQGAFRRGGIAFGAEPMTLTVKSLSKEQLAAIRAEPMLRVTDTEVLEAEADAPVTAALADKPN